MICINSVRVYPGRVTLRTGNWYYGAFAEVCPTYATCNCITWYSSNTSVATVNPTTGYIYARAAGTARIYAEATDGSGVSDYCTVTVTSGTINVSSLELNRSSISLQNGNSYTIYATVCPSNATNRSISWRSSNTAVATVSGGTVYAHGTGSAWIYATAQDGSGASDSCYVNVTGNTLVTSVTVSPSSKTMTVGGSAYLYETICPTNATNKCVTWSSSNPSVATVNPDSGLVYARAAGSATIYATATDGSGKRGSCAVTVSAPIAVTDITVCPSSLTMNVGEMECLCATVYPTNAANQTVTWCSSDESVATVGLYTGCVEAIGAGTTVITATTEDGDFQDYCGVTIDGREKVEISKDGYYFNVNFSNGLTWKSINYDLSNTSYTVPQKAWDRYNYNKTKSFSEKQIAFIYLFDPLGIEYYIKYYYVERNIEVADLLFFKDRVYKEIFGVKPRFFRILPNETVVYFNNSGTITPDFRETVYSDAEVLFGSHLILDAIAITGFVTDILSSIFTSLPVVSEIALGVDLYKALFYSGSISNVLSGGASMFLDEYISSTPGTGALKMFGWVGNLVDALEIISDTFVPPNLNDITIYNKIKSQNYKTNFVIEGSEISIDEIIDRCIIN